MTRRRTACSHGRHRQPVSSWHPASRKQRMTPPVRTPPGAEIDPQDHGRLVLRGRWTLRNATRVAVVLASVPDGISAIDATGVERLDTLGVLQLLRFAA